jgi:hypothetical protein
LIDLTIAIVARRGCILAVFAMVTRRGCILVVVAMVARRGCILAVFALVSLRSLGGYGGQGSGRRRRCFCGGSGNSVLGQGGCERRRRRR